MNAVLQYFGTVTLIFPEQNMVADRMDKNALGASEKKEFFRIHDLSTTV